MDLNKIFSSLTFRRVLIGIGVLVVLLLVFQAGMFVGFHKASFSYGWGENYHRNFAGPQGGFVDDFMGRDFIDAHGVFGAVIKVDADTSSIVINGRDNVERIILLNDDTSIKRFRDNIKIKDLEVGSPIVVIGDPNDAGQIEAKLIRVMPVGQASEESFPGGQPPMPLLGPANQSF